MHPRIAHHAVLGIGILMLTALTGCRADPNNALGQETLTKMVEGESRQAMAVTAFTKTNGIKREVQGQGVYTMEFSSQLRFAKAGWKGGDAFVGQFTDFSVADAHPSGFAGFGKSWSYYDASDEVEVTGEITFENTEKGWRATGREIKAYRVTSSKKEQLLNRLVGHWNGNTIWFDTQENRHKPGADYVLDFIRDSKGVKMSDRKPDGNGKVYPEDNVYVQYAAGRLHGRFILGKHGGTHGMEFDQTFTLQLRDDGTLVYEDYMEGSDSKEPHTRAELKKQ